MSFYDLINSSIFINRQLSHSVSFRYSSSVEICHVVSDTWLAPWLLRWVEDDLAVLPVKQRLKGVLEPRHGEPAGDDLFDVDLAVSDQSLGLFPRVVDLAPVDGLQR